MTWQTRRRTACARLAVLALASWQLSRTARPVPAAESQRLREALEDPHRVDRLKPEAIIQKLALKPGQVVADIGSGSGLFTRPLAKAVQPSGKVYAVDIDPELLDYVRRRPPAGNRQHRYGSGAGGFPIPSPRFLDLALICDTCITSPGARPTQEPEGVPEPNGRLVIIDFSTGWPEGHESMRFTMDDLAVWTQAAGFVKIAEFEEIEGNFFHVYSARRLGQ